MIEGDEVPRAIAAATLGMTADLTAVGRQNPWDGKTSCGPPILMMQAS